MYNYINLDYLKILAYGDNSFVLKTIRSFIQELNLALGKMQGQIADKKWNDLYITAHSIRPNVNLMGMKTIEVMIKYIENSASTGSNLDRLYAVFNQIKNAEESILAELEEEIKSLNYAASER